MKGLNVKLPIFYKSCLESWCTIVNKDTVNTKDDILNQSLFGNCKIVHGKQQSNFFSNWTKSNLFKIKDIWDVTNGRWRDSDLSAHV